MHLSELIKHLTDFHEDHGDLEVFIKTRIPSQREEIKPIKILYAQRMHDTDYIMIVQDRHRKYRTTLGVEE